jgi:hypothetical protein
VVFGNLPVVSGNPPVVVGYPVSIPYAAADFILLGCRQSSLYTKCCYILLRCRLIQFQFTYNLLVV